MSPTPKKMLPKVSPLEKVVRGYALFREADASDKSHWAPTSPLGDALAGNVKLYDYDVDRQKPVKTNKAAVLEYLRTIKKKTRSCELLEASEVNGYVHTVDRSNVEPKGLHLCVDFFKFNGAGKISEIRYCAAEMPPA